MTPDHNNDLDWLAFCCAAGELDADQTEQFEARLADDQAAREALARAVELTQIVAAAESQCGDFVVPGAHSFVVPGAHSFVVPGAHSTVVVANRTNSDWNRRLSWMAVGGLAS